MVRLADRPDMTLDVYRGRKRTIQQNLHFLIVSLDQYLYLISCLYLSNHLKSVNDTL